MCNFYGFIRGSYLQASTLNSKIKLAFLIWPIFYMSDLPVSRRQQREEIDEILEYKQQQVPSTLFIHIARVSKRKIENNTNFNSDTSKGFKAICKFWIIIYPVTKG